MSDRPQWMLDTVAEMWSDDCADMRARDLEIIARHYAAEDARVQELRESAGISEIVLAATETVLGHTINCDCSQAKAIKRLRKALKAWEK